MLLFLDDALYSLHFAVLCFALTGWLHARFRVLHRWVMAVIALFWLVIGPLIGEAGFCPLSWLQKKVRILEGAPLLQHSYIDDLLAHAGLVFRPELVDVAGTAAFIVLMALAFLHWTLEADFNRWRTA